MAATSGLPRRAALSLPPAALLLLLAQPALALPQPTERRVLDTARVLPPSRLASLERTLAALEADTGFRVRVAAVGGQLDGRRGSAGPDGPGFRARWGASGDSTLYVLADPTQGAALAFSAGPAVRASLGPDFLQELSGRYGNTFFVHDEGLDEGLVRTVAALDTCLRRAAAAAGVCPFVPGVPDDLAWLTLPPSVVAGTALGYALRQPDADGGPAKWALLTAPLWLFLLVSFGILPVWLRDPSPGALAPNLGGFTLAAGLLYLTPIFGDNPFTRKKGDGDDRGGGGR